MFTSLQHKSIVYSVTCQDNRHLHIFVDFFYKFIQQTKFRLHSLFRTRILSLPKETAFVLTTLANPLSISEPNHIVCTRTDAIPELPSIIFQNEVSDHSISVMIPSQDVNGNKFDPTEIRLELSELFTEAYGGCTMYPGFGIWPNDDGKLISEPVIKLESYASNPVFAGSLNKIGLSILKLKKKYNQGKFAVILDGKMYLL